MHPSIRSDQHIRELALAEARNAVGPDEPLPVFLQQECLSPQEYAEISKSPTYQRYLKDYKAELTENGFSFQAKARVLAEDLLADMYLMAKDADTPAVTRLKTLENLVDWGKLAPKTAQGEQAGAGFSVTINIGGASAAKTIDITQPKPAIPVPARHPPPLDQTVTDVPPADNTILEILAAELDLDTTMYYAAEADPGV